MPVLYWIHGGGQVFGDSRTGILEPFGWASELDMVVVSVDYRLAPETPFPGPVEDNYAGLARVGEHAAEIGGDPERVVSPVRAVAAGWRRPPLCSLVTRTCRRCSPRC